MATEDDDHVPRTKKRRERLPLPLVLSCSLPFQFMALVIAIVLAHIQYILRSLQRVILGHHTAIPEMPLVLDCTIYYIMPFLGALSPSLALVPHATSSSAYGCTATFFMSVR